ncbi:MAG: hypothetical protein WCJ64_07480 [Rhodospirillaceae bacterium]
MGLPNNVVSYERFRFARILSAQSKLQSDAKALQATFHSLQGELMEMGEHFSQQQSIFQGIRDDCSNTLEFCRQCEQIAGSTDDIERMEHERDRLVWQRALRNRLRSRGAAAEA